MALDELEQLLIGLAETVRLQTRIREAYGIRSTYFHGRPPKKNMEKETEYRRQVTALRNPVLSYARLALLKYLESDPARWQEDVLEALDRSLLDSKASETLTGRISGGLWDLAAGVSEGQPATPRS